MPSSLRLAVTKKAYQQYHSLLEQGNAHPILSDLQTRLEMAFSELDLVLQEGTVSIGEAVTSLTRAAVLLSKFTPLSETVQPTVISSITHLSAHLLGVTGAGASTNWSNAMRENSADQERFCKTAVFFVLQVLAAFPANEYCSDLYEGEIWQVVQVLVPLIVKNDLELCRNRMKSNRLE